MQKLVSIVAAFAIISILAFLTVNWVQTVPEPTNVSTPEYEVYQNLTNTTELAFTAQESVLLLIAVAMILVAFLIIYKWLM